MAVPMIGVAQSYSIDWYKIAGGGGTSKFEVDSNGAPQMTLDNSGNLECSGTVYSHGIALTSDRNAKENFQPVDNQAVLAKVAALPVTEWNYKTDSRACSTSARWRRIFTPPSVWMARMTNTSPWWTKAAWRWRPSRG